MQKSFKINFVFQKMYVPAIHTDEKPYINADVNQGIDKCKKTVVHRIGGNAHKKEIGNHTCYCREGKIYTEVEADRGKDVRLARKERTERNGGLQEHNLCKGHNNGVGKHIKNGCQYIKDI